MVMLSFGCLFECDGQAGFLDQGPLLWPALALGVARRTYQSTSNTPQISALRKGAFLAVFWLTVMTLFFWVSIDFTASE